MPRPFVCRTLGSARDAGLCGRGLSANHRGSLDEARQLIHAAADAGAMRSSCKPIPPNTLTIDSQREWFRIEAGTLWSGPARSNDLYQEAYTPWEWHPELKHEPNEAA